MVHLLNQSVYDIIKVCWLSVVLSSALCTSTVKSISLWFVKQPPNRKHSPTPPYKALCTRPKGQYQDMCINSSLRVCTVLQSNLSLYHSTFLLSQFTASKMPPPHWTNSWLCCISSNSRTWLHLHTASQQPPFLPF